MAVLPIGFFMPLPLPIMIPFMMWQSAAIAAGFGTYFQYAKRRVSAMSNEEFNKFTPSQGVNQMFDDIMSQIPSSFERARSINNLILQSLSDFLADGIKFLSDKLGGQLNQPFSFTGPPTDDIPDRPPFEFQNPFVNPLPQAFPEEAPPTTTPFLPTPTGEPEGPPAPPLTQQQLLDKYANWKTYRQKGGLLTEQQWRVARRGQSGGIPITPPRTTIPKDESGKTFHPAFYRQIKSLTNNRLALLKQLDAIQIFIASKTATLNNLIKQRQQTGSSRNNSLINSITREIQQKQRDDITLTNQIKVIQKAINDFNNKFTPFK